MENINAVGAFVALTFLAVFTEWLNERLFGGWLKGKQMIATATVIGLALTCSIKIGGLSLLGIDASAWVDRVITGLVVGGGSNAVHAFFKDKLGRV